MKPNIIFITCDELRADALGAYGGGAVATPNLDGLAKRGTLFSNAYTVSPWCLPSRCSMLTGLYPHNSKAYSNFRACALDGSLPNMFNILGKHGYFTTMFGKCHFAPVDYNACRSDATLEHGMKKYFESLGMDYLLLQDDKGGSVHFYDDYSRELEAAGFLDAYRELTADHKGVMDVFDFPGPDEWHPDYWLGEKVTDYINNYDNSKPLMAWVSFSGPHYTFDAPVSYHSRVNADAPGGRLHRPGEYDDPERAHYKSFHGPGGIDASYRVKDGACKNFNEEYWERLRLRYYANVALLDDKIGEIIFAAKKRFGENILILFTADHGEMLGDHSLWGKNNCAYEQVWKVPLLAEFPAGTQAPHFANEKVCLLEILPTFLKAAGIPREGRLDGFDLLECAAAGGREYVFAEGEGYAAVTDGRFKYVHIEQHDGSYRELYDVERDPFEFLSFARNQNYSQTLASLREKLVGHFLADALP